MKPLVAVSLTCFIIAGILSSTNGSEARMRQLCLKNGGPTAYNALEKSFENLKECGQSILIDWQNELVKSKTQDMSAAFELYCGKVGTMKNCLKGFIDSIATCMDPKDRETINRSNALLHSVLQFVCDESKLIEKAIKSQNRDCASSKVKSMQFCADNLKAANGLNRTTFDLMEPSTDPADMLASYKLNYDSQGCSAILQAEQCAIKVLNQCPDKVFADLLDSLYKYVNNDIPCDNLPRVPRSEASPASVGNILLLLVAVIATAF